MAELPGNRTVNDTLGALFLGNLAAAMYVTTLIAFLEMAEMVFMQYFLTQQSLRHHLRPDLHILPEEFKRPAGLQAPGKQHALTQMSKS
jgi:hypothetical protein